jgi:hypothetical protein
MSPLDNPSAMSRAISSCRGVSTRPSGEERLAGGLAAMIGDVFCVSVPCPLCYCSCFVHPVQQDQVLIVPHARLIPEVLYGAGQFLDTAIVFGEQAVFIRAVQAGWYRVHPRGAMGIGCRERWSVSFVFPARRFHPLRNQCIVH